MCGQLADYDSREYIRGTPFQPVVWIENSQVFCFYLAQRHVF